MLLLAYIYIHIYTFLALLIVLLHFILSHFSCYHIVLVAFCQTHLINLYLFLAFITDFMTAGEHNSLSWLLFWCKCLVGRIWPLNVHQMLRDDWWDLRCFHLVFLLSSCLFFAVLSSERLDSSAWLAWTLASSRATFECSLFFFLFAKEQNDRRSSNASCFFVCLMWKQTDLAPPFMELIISFEPRRVFGPLSLCCSGVWCFFVGGRAKEAASCSQLLTWGRFTGSHVLTGSGCIDNS